MKVLNLIKPNKEEREELNRNVKNFLRKFKNLKEIKLIAGGSYAKDTWLKGNYDIDIFAKFNYKKFKNKDISKLLGKILKKKFKKISKVHGSRDYYQIKINKFLFEIVPVLDIKKNDKALNVTDLSPKHVNYVVKNIGKLKDDVRLAKQFCIANKLYGAESYIRGFSGYVLEVLVIYYKGFNRLLKKTVKWKAGDVIDVKKFYKSKKDVLKNLNKSKKSPLILIDPVQKDRNIAAALSLEKFNKFKKLASVYLKNKSELFFIKKEKDLNKLKDYFILKIEPLKGKRDIVGSKLLKSLKCIKMKLDSEGFLVKDYGWKWDKNAYFWFKIKNKKLSKFKKHYGPLVKQKEHLKSFEKKWKKHRIYREKGRVYVNMPRKFVNAGDFLRYLLKDKNVNRRVKSIKLQNQKVYK
jgi:tRNA nucleotidyltransferase (CCA-adding enzyme)